ncbi:MAG: hypothetical protein IPO92_18155 [Saprospiraceae bacterium]|nr:hypothetical protein [Saprospiraceae bacterium]
MVIVHPNLPIEIFPKDPLSCSADNGEKCAKACAGSTLTYGFINPNSSFPPQPPLSISVTGAASYSINYQASEITVTWGNGGSGSITAVSFSGSTKCISEGSICIEILKDIDVDFTIPICENTTSTYTTDDCGFF